MSELITAEIFTDGQQNINAANMNGIIGRATVQPAIIANKPQSASMNIADTFLVLKTDNTLAQSRFDTIVNSTSSALPVADTTKNGMLRQVSGKTTDVVDGTNHCVPISSFLPPGVVVDYAAGAAPAGWLLCNGQSVSRTTYAALFAVIGTGYGSVDGNTFNVPNYAGKILAMAGGSYGAFGTTGGAATVALAIGNLPAHSHSITDVAHAHTVPAHGHTATDSGHTHPVNSNVATIGVTGGGSTINYFGPTGTGTGFANITVAAQGAFAVTSSGTGLSTTNNTGSGTVFSILPPYQVTNKIIKV